MNQLNHQPDYQTLLGCAQVVTRFTSEGPIIPRPVRKTNGFVEFGSAGNQPFLGMVITMFYRDHGPPHFHATYGDYAVTVSIRDSIVTGRFPKRALNLVSKWCALHQQELIENWELAQQRKPLKRIASLE